MPRFFFHTEDGHFVADQQGTELEDEAAAKVEAVRLAGTILAERPQKLWETQRWRILVTPEQGQALFGIEVQPVDGKFLVPWHPEGRH